MKKTGKIIFCTVAGIAIMALLVAAIMWLWNLLIPAITGWACITFWQALGLAVLFRLLTGHLGHPMQVRQKRRHLHKMRNMPFEERKRFIREQLWKLSNEDSDNEK